MKRKIITAFALAFATMLTACAFAACSAPETQEGEGEGAWTFTLESHIWNYTDAEGQAATYEYGLYFPEAYSDDGDPLPLITYMPDSGALKKNVSQLATCEMPVQWITKEKMEKNPAVFLIVTLTEAAEDVTEVGSEPEQVNKIIDYLCENYNIDTDRLYLTGQSMGGIMFFSFNTAFPDKFAATVYVACQPGGEVSTEEAPYEQYDKILAAEEFVDQKFIYIASRGDSKAPYGQDDLERVLISNGKTEGVDYKKYYELDIADQSGNDETIRSLISDGCYKYFLAYPSVGGANGTFEHLKSFAYCYQLDSVFEWLMAQSR